MFKICIIRVIYVFELRALYEHSQVLTCHNNSILYAIFVCINVRGNINFKNYGLSMQLQGSRQQQDAGHFPRLDMNFRPVV